VQFLLDADSLFALAVKSEKASSTADGSGSTTFEFACGESLPRKRRLKAFSMRFWPILATESGREV
jgi:hypothetical protein